jgi:hypothetical protein
MMLNRIDKAVRRRLRLRRFHAYCVGAAKTGTTTVSAMLKSHYLSAHEPETVATNRLMIDLVSGARSRSDVAEALRQRDDRLHLEMDSSHPLGYAAPILHEIFPTALFIVTIREPYSWLRSRINFHDRTDPPKWREYRQYFWHSRNEGYAPEEKALEARGVASLDTYLRQYAEHYRIVPGSLDPARTLVLRTSELSTAPAAIAEFLRIPERRLHVAHDKKAPPGEEDLLSTIDESFVRQRIALHCGELIDEWFPEIRSNYSITRPSEE